ncbi:rhodanese-related sulfurtransferase [Halogeometricum pallidum JCM 14848]|uniref:Rhodanese-related sulfurtransferase n=1 Tax=Halogeometricum pallidum JCM 14848 TaxID=1227487 RepID=M0D7M5_HALPD|nr:rhodanese-like domain-containing protein [Halogeometricum pallidum]ELZ30838.1 rhodanese-related sulfurtransferase [Halogeometricum pallidum JCM 14848]
MYEHIVVSPDWVAARLGAGGDGSVGDETAGEGNAEDASEGADAETVRLVDVRDAWEFDGIGHLPGAVSVPFDEFRSSEGDEGMLPGEEAWESLLSAVGIGPDDHLVAYDDTHGVFAARFLVTAELYGHPTDRLHLLDGDYSAWNRERETTTEAAAYGETTYEVREPERSPLVGYDAVLDSLDDGDTVVVDTREDWEYEEGHLPGAVNLDWRELVDDETRGLKSPEELEAVLESVGVTPDERVVLYCNTARRISHTYVVLRSLGYEDVAFYEGSLTEWEERGGPTETETETETA